MFDGVGTYSQRKITTLVLFVTVAVFCSLCPICDLFADTIVLKEGQRLTGDILAEKPTNIYMDIGITVLSIPREKILKYEYSKTSEANNIEVKDVNNLGAAPGKSEQPPRLPVGRQERGLYRIANLNKTTIEKCVEAVSEAVLMVSSPAGMGSGFFINEEGYLITNYHVIEKETRIEVTVFRKTAVGFEKKRFKKVRIEAINSFIDLALLKVEDAGDAKVKFVCLGDSDRVEVGEGVFAIGNPLGLERTVTNGVISTKNRAFEGLVYIQTNADINPGNSGGPLFNLAGEVVGVTNMGYIFYGGLGFAIPVNYVKNFIENRDAFLYDKDNPNTGYKYVQPDRRRNKERLNFLKKKDVPSR
jgi:serine protease Do